MSNSENRHPNIQQTNNNKVQLFVEKDKDVLGKLPGVDIQKAAFIDKNILHRVLKNAEVIYGPKQHASPKFTIQNVLGRGSYATVLQVFEEESNERFAVKVICRQVYFRRIHRDQVRDIRNEVLIHSSVNHENIIRLYHAFLTETHAFLVMELADNSLSNLIEERFPFNEEYISKIAKGLMSGLMFCHRAGLVHRDVKCENVLLVNGVAKICDFGCSCATGDVERLARKCGTFQYQAPESTRQIENDLHLPSAVDFFALGVTLFRTIFRAYPDFEEDELSGETVIFPPFPRISNHAMDVISGLLHENPFRRYGGEILSYHVWFHRTGNMSQRASRS